MASSSNQGLRQQLKDYNPGQTGPFRGGYRPREISIRLFGTLGHGKSSFVNNCLSVVHDTEYRNQAGEGDVSGGCTIELKPYPLSDYVNIVDNRGAKLFNSNELHEFSAQMDGKRSEGHRVKFGGWWTYFIDFFTRRVEVWKSSLIVPVIIYSADFPSLEQDKARLQSFIDDARNKTGMWPIIVVTRAKEKVNSKFKSFFQNLRCFNFFLLNNYHIKELKDGSEAPVERNEETDKMILEILLRCLECADDVMKSISTDHKPAHFY